MMIYNLFEVILMKNRNICKFISEANLDSLEIICFVYESDYDTITNEIIESCNRAILIKQGTGQLITDSIVQKFNAGDLLFTFKDENVKIETDSCEYLYISFVGSRSEALFKRFGISKTNRCFDGFDSMIPIWQDSLLRASDKNIDLTAEGILLYTFSRLISGANEQSGIINEIIQITEENFSNPNLSISQIAETLNYNSKYISHLFKKQTGMNYSEYIKNMRLKYAVALFDSGVDSIKNVAALSGFSDPLYFSSVFKKSIGISPKEYTKKIK